tara:strand:+ start:204 stop:443 length:240 start_codon:yes stop_codon:yes gene_type:complete
MKDDRGEHDLTKIIDDCRNLVDELRAKLKLKCNQVLDLRKQLDYAQEQTQLAELKYNKLQTAIENQANDRLNKSKQEGM